MISPTNSNLLLRWVYLPSGFVLQTSAAIGAQADWQTVPDPGVTNDAFREVTVPLETNRLGRFYRLVWRPGS